MGECFLYRRGGGSGGGSPVLPEVEKTVFGRSLVLTDSTSKPLKGLRLFGRTTQNGTPSPDNPVPLVSPGDGGSITVEVGASSGDQNPQRLVCNTPNGLPGLKVSSGGNMADENGQQWICDEIDSARGKHVHRVWQRIFSSIALTTTFGWETKYLALLASVEDMMPSDYGPGLCNMFVRSGGERTNNSIRIGTDGTGDIFIYSDEELFASYESASSFFANNPVVVLYPLATPIETDLTAEELAQYAALHTNSLYTTISNTAGADMEVTYIAIGG